MLAPLALFYEDVLRVLDTNGVAYVVVDGTAVILHGVPRTTMDLDLVPDYAPTNMHRLVDALTSIGFVPRAPVPAHQLADPARRAEWIRDKGLRAFSFNRPSRPLDAVDILLDSPLSYEALSMDSETLNAGVVSIRIASIAHLIVLKQRAGRAQDLSDIDALQRLQEARRG